MRVVACIRPEYLLAPKLSYCSSSSGRRRAGSIRMMTIAPELEGAPEVIAEAAQRGVCVSLGHSDADFAGGRTRDRGGSAARDAYLQCHAPARPSDTDHHSPGILGAVLTDRRVSADIIADGVHLDPAIVKLVARRQRP